MSMMIVVQILCGECPCLRGIHGWDQEIDVGISCGGATTSPPA